MDFVDFHGLVGGAVLEGKRLAVQQMLVGQEVKPLEEKVLVLSVGLNLPGEGGVLLSELLLLGFLVNEGLMDEDELVLVDLLGRPEVEFILAEPLDLYLVRGVLSEDRSG